ncbi:MAG: redoxin domain-containing protein [Pirellulales bacterium]
MSKMFVGTWSVLVLVGALAAAAEPAAESDLGKVERFQLNDTAGKPRISTEWVGRKAVVYCFLGIECPVSNGYAPQMQRLADKFAPQGVTFVGVYSERKVTLAAAQTHRDEYRIGFDCLIDVEQKLASQCRIARVPTIVVVQPDGTIVYRGRIDDRWSPEGRRRDVPRTRDLEDALAAVLTGKTPPTAETSPFGCPLVYKDPAAAVPLK